MIRERYWCQVRVIMFLSYDDLCFLIQPYKAEAQIMNTSDNKDLPALYFDFVTIINMLNGEDLNSSPHSINY